jgi:hypothetical protein
MKIWTAFALSLAVFALSVSSADANGRKKKGYYSYYSANKQMRYSHRQMRYGYRPRRYAQGRVRPQVRGYYFQPGGYAFGYELEPFLYKNDFIDYGFRPYFDDRNFWERVQSDPLNTRPGNSGL